MVIITKNSKLPVFKIISASFHLAALHYKILLKLAIPLIVVPLALIALSATALFSTITPEHTYSDIFINVFGGVLLMIFLFSPLLIFLFSIAAVMTVVGFHRTFLLNDKTTIFRWGWTETKYFGWTILLTWIPWSIPIIAPLLLRPLAITLPSVILQIAAIASLVFSVLLIYFIARISLVLPATAINDPGVGLKQSWQLTKNNGWRLAFLLGVLPIITTFILGPLAMLVPVVYPIIIFCIYALLFVIQTCLLSLCYNFFQSYSAWQNNKQSTTNP